MSREGGSGSETRGPVALSGFHLPAEFPFMNPRGRLKTGGTGHGGSQTRSPVALTFQSACAPLPSLPSGRWGCRVGPQAVGQGLCVPHLGVLGDGGRLKTGGTGHGGSQTRGPVALTFQSAFVLFLNTCGIAVPNPRLIATIYLSRNDADGGITRSREKPRDLDEF